MSLQHRVIAPIIQLDALPNDWLIVRGADQGIDLVRQRADGVYVIRPLNFSYALPFVQSVACWPEFPDWRDSDLRPQSAREA